MRKWVKPLGIVILILEIALVVTTGLSIYTNLQTLGASLMSGDDGPVHTQESVDSVTGARTFTIGLNVTNRGLLEVLFKLKIRAVAEERVIAEGEESRRVPPGRSEPLSVSFTISKDDWDRYVGGSLRPDAEIGFEIRSFFDLMGFGITLRMKG